MTEREKEILGVLANGVRVMSVSQIARTWWSPTDWGRRRALQAARRFGREGWLHTHRALSRPVNTLARPLLAWHPGDANPDLVTLSGQLRRRAIATAHEIEVVSATRKTCDLFGWSSLSTIRLTQMTHDLHVTEVFLTYRRRGMPIDRWRGDDRLPRDWPLRDRPDAVLLDAEGNVAGAIEYGGGYSVERLTKLHRGLMSFGTTGLSYEVW